MGVSRHQYSNPTPEQKQAACRMWRDGKDTHDIAAKFDWHESIVYNGLPKWLRAEPVARAA